MTILLFFFSPSKQAEIWNSVNPVREDSLSWEQHILLVLKQSAFLIGQEISSGNPILS